MNMDILIYITIGLSVLALIISIYNTITTANHKRKIQRELDRNKPYNAHNL